MGTSVLADLSSETHDYEPSFPSTKRGVEGVSVLSSFEFPRNRDRSPTFMIYVTYKRVSTVIFDLGRFIAN